MATRERFGALAVIALAACATSAGRTRTGGDLPDLTSVEVDSMVAFLLRETFGQQGGQLPDRGVLEKYGPTSPVLVSRRVRSSPWSLSGSAVPDVGGTALLLVTDEEIASEVKRRGKGVAFVAFDVLPSHPDEVWFEYGVRVAASADSGTWYCTCQWRQAFTRIRGRWIRTKQEPGVCG